MGTEDLDAVIDELRTDPVHVLSLGSKELFHSNLLRWFAEMHRPVGDALLAAFGSEYRGPVTAEREHRHLDLVLREPGGSVHLVVENKLFALPDEHQLARYSSAVRKLGSPPAVLLSLASPGWTERQIEDVVWRHVSYESLAAVLEPVHLPQEDPFTADLFHRWIQTMRRLAKLYRAAGQPSDVERLWLSGTTGEQALDATLRKFRAHHLARRIRVELDEPLPDGIVVSAGLTRGTGLVEAFVHVGHEVEIGWQLQGDQWRRALRVRDTHPAWGKGQHAARGDLATRSGWFDFPSELLKHGAPRPELPRFGKFDPDFIYRYVKVPDLTVGDAVAIGIRELRRAQRFCGEQR